MARMGRPPTGSKLVDRLDGSDQAKARARAILATLAGECSALAAARALDCNEARFHSLRSRTLQDMVRSLEPRTPGRKPKPVDPRDEEITRLRAELEGAQQALRTLDVQLQLATAGIGRAEPVKRPLHVRSKKRRAGR